tara:strand:+ start:63 stop:407 length:345 start_codon:yes stop_codon:yes gene_type:complete
MKSNNPPYVTLDLDENDAVMLQRLLLRDRAVVGMDFREVCEMSSSDPRSHMRSSVSMVLAGDMDWDEEMSRNITSQQPKLVEDTNAYADLISEKVNADWAARKRKDLSPKEPTK